MLFAFGVEHLHEQQFVADEIRRLNDDVRGFQAVETELNIFGLASCFRIAINNRHSLKIVLEWLYLLTL